MIGTKGRTACIICSAVSVTAATAILLTFLLNPTNNTQETPTSTQAADNPVEAEPDPPQWCTSNCTSLDHSLWSSVLTRYLTSGGTSRGVSTALFDYDSLQQATDAEFEAYKEYLAGVDLASLSRNEEMALWLNAYNAMAVEVVRTNCRASEGCRSIRATGLANAVWTTKIGVVAGDSYSLDEIEKGRLLPRFNDNRIHASVVCASISCPDLQPSAFSAVALEQQLQDAMQGWLENPHKGVLLQQDSATLHLSRLFLWYPEDFGRGACRDMGFTPSRECRAALITLLGDYLSAAETQFLQTNIDGLSIEWMVYNWDLNVG